MLLNTKQIRSSYRFTAGYECPLMKSVSKDIVARSARWTTIWRTHIVRDKDRFEYNTVSRGTLARVSSSVKSIMILSPLRGIENKKDIMRATGYIYRCKKLHNKLQ